MIGPMAQQTVLSVRGEARRTIAPDYAVLHCALSATAGSKPDALAQLRAAQHALIGSLTGLGGVPLTVESRRSALTWSVGSVATHDEHDVDKATGRHGPTGRVIANAAVVITARDMTLLKGVGEALASVERLNVDGVSWHVDADNEQWRGVRADAIAAAIDKGRDYALALGGTVRRVEHVADAGLLGSGDAPAGHEMSFGLAASARSAEFGGPAGTPSLDPVPQEIQAVVEARLIAEVEPLA
jgi:uncharacterized protein YggE